MRDLFDAYLLLTQGALDRERLRLAFLVYGGLNRVDWRTVTIEHVVYDVRELESQLLPVLHGRALAGISDMHAWARQLVEGCRQGLAIVLPLCAHEHEFLDRLLDYGEIAPALLTPDEHMRQRIARHPGLLWKALNVRQHRL